MFLGGSYVVKVNNRQQYDSNEKYQHYFSRSLINWTLDTIFF